MSGSDPGAFKFGDVVRRREDDVVVMVVGHNVGGDRIAVQETTTHGGGPFLVAPGGTIGLTLADPLGITGDHHYPVGKSCWLTGLVEKVDE